MGAAEATSFWLIEHACSQISEPLFYVDCTRPMPWSVEKARARRFRSKDGAWDYVLANLNRTLVRVRRHF